jgi:hypothetical protein
VVDDQVRHHVRGAAQGLDVVPAAESRIDQGVVDRIEAGVRPVDRVKEGEQVHRPEQPRQLTGQQLATPDAEGILASCREG